jgi:hypothetical protein
VFLYGHTSARFSGPPRGWRKWSGSYFLYQDSRKLCEQIWPRYTKPKEDRSKKPVFSHRLVGLSSLYWYTVHLIIFWSARSAVCCILQCKAEVAVDEAAWKTYVTFTYTVLFVRMIHRYFKGFARRRRVISRTVRAQILDRKSVIVTEDFCDFVPSHREFTEIVSD